MDPLSAFAVACNVLQIIEVGVKVLSKAADYRKAETGLLTEQRDLREVMQSLNGLSTDLQAKLPAQATTNQHTIEETHLVEANNQCLRLSKEFLAFLDRLKLRERHSILGSLRTSLKTLWHKEKMDAMERSISQARDNLNVTFLVYMNSKQATQRVQDEILRNTTRAEGSILQAVTSTSESIQGDINLLTEQLNNANLDGVQQVVAHFTSSHRDLLEQLSKNLGSILAMHTNFRVLSDENETAAAYQKILDSLHFPQIHDRKDHVLTAHDQTYRWVLEPKQGDRRRWDDFTAWLRASPSESRIYWVYGKIGAGKSTLLRYLDDNLTAPDHMVPWVCNGALVRASCFFWSAGNKLQKSATGLLRTLLSQLFEQAPDLIPQVVQPRKWHMARLNGHHSIEWTDLELANCLREYVLYAAKSKMVLLFVDGLDEFEGTEDAREDMLNLLIGFAANENVKICLSSRPWNIFRDTFGDCPQLRLEDLTHSDISAYIRAQLYGNPRFLRLVRYTPSAAESLVTKVNRKASGVFLWVRLVVRQLLKGLRDGDEIYALEEMVEAIPADLDDYFMRLMESIESQYRKEASELLQIALYEEENFTSLHSNSLLDFSFIQEGSPDFALEPSYRFSRFDFADTGAMALRLESTTRKINSRCMGLLEGKGQRARFFQPRRFDEASDENYSDEDRQEVSDEDYSEEGPIASEVRDNQETGSNLPPQFTDPPGYYAIFDLGYHKIDFIHRSLRDFLLTPKVQAMLHQHTGGVYDVRMFFRNARLVQLVALVKVELDLDRAVGLASYVLSTLTIPEYRHTSSASAFAGVMKPVMENLARFKHAGYQRGWYICSVLQKWHEEEGTFMSLAIDFGLDSYVDNHLRTKMVLTKSGRPLLDHVLRPRFVNSFNCVGNQLPRTGLLSTVIALGAHPNQQYRSISVWARFVCFVADQFREALSDITLHQKVAYFEALKIMIQNGADSLLPKHWLSDAASSDAYDGDDHFDDLSDYRFYQRFPSTIPAIEGDTRATTFYAVGDLLEQSRGLFGHSLDLLKAMIEAQEIAFKPSD